MTQSMRNVYSGEKWVNSTPDRIHKNEHYYMFPIGLGVIALGSWLYYRFSKKKDMSQSAVASAAPPVNGPTVVELGDGCRLVCDDGEAETVETIDEWAMYGEVPQQESAEFVDELAAQGSYQQQQQAPASPSFGQASSSTGPSFGQASPTGPSQSGISQASSTTSMVQRPLRRKL